VCNSAFELSFVSQNISQLIGIEREGLIGNRAIWSKLIFQEDLEQVFRKMRKLAHAGSISFSHRIADKHGLPMWVSHGARLSVCDADEYIYGCMMPMHIHENSGYLEPTTISHFLHKMGNHFQLINLIVNSLRKSLPDSDEVDALDDTVEKTVELMRALSQYSQTPAWVSAVELAEVIESAAITRSALFVQKRVRLQRFIEPSLHGVTAEGDPYLLELAIGEVIQNAFEATNEGGAVVVNAQLEWADGAPHAVKLRVIDGGHGIDSDDTEGVTRPFSGAKSKGHGLGLCLAVRFVELHGGILRVVSGVREGTEVQITLPLRASRDNSCR